MIVTEENRCGPGPDDRTEDVAGVDLDAGETPAGEHLVEEDAVSDVDRDGPEFFDGETLKSRPHVGPDVGGAGESLPSDRALPEREPRELDSAA